VSSPISRRAFLKSAALAGGLTLYDLTGARLLAAGQTPASQAGRPVEAGAAGKEGAFDQAEGLTRQYLAEMEQRLRAFLDKEDLPYADELRMWLIHLVMLPGLSGPASSFLEYLGDSETARKRLFFLMPLVRWMSEPFLFPLETKGSLTEQEREMGKVFALMDRLREQGFSASLDNVGDASLSPADAKAYQAYYAALIRAFLDADGAQELFMSLKLSALVHDLGAALDDGAAGRAKRGEIVAALTGLLDAAARAPEKNIFLRIDMEEYAYKDLTLRLFRQIVEDEPALVTDAEGRLRLGVVVQTYLRDAASDVRMLAEWARSRSLRAPVRLVKGAYLDYERETAAREGRPSPVWDNKPSTDANFEAVSAYVLLNRDALDPAFATHNIRSQAHAMALAKTYGLPPEAAPIQMLYGMGDPIKHVVASMNRPLREYVPAGSLARGLKYAGRRFAELAGSDNALARTMRGDFSEMNSATPAFTGQRDLQDAEAVRGILEEALAKRKE